MTPKEVVQTMYDCFTTGDMVKFENTGGILHLVSGEIVLPQMG